MKPKSIPNSLCLFVEGSSSGEKRILGRTVYPRLSVDWAFAIWEIPSCKVFLLQVKCCFSSWSVRKEKVQYPCLCWGTMNSKCWGAENSNWIGETIIFINRCFLWRIHSSILWYLRFISKLKFAFIFRLLDDRALKMSSWLLRFEDDEKLFVLFFEFVRSGQDFNENDLIMVQRRTKNCKFGWYTMNVLSC